MSEWVVRVVQVGEVTKHPNADSLSIVDVEGYPCIIRTGDFAEGDKAVYIPVDSIVPNDPRWSFLDNRRIKAKRLRGVFSMGLLSQADPSWSVGDVVHDALGITKHDPDAAQETANPNGVDDTDPKTCPVYDIEGLRKYKHELVPGEEVWISEKIHGQNARFVHDGTRLHAGSRTRFKKLDSETTWANVARKYELESKLERYPGIAIYGETYGNNTDMPYGVNRAKDGDALVLFDALDTKTRRWFDVDEFLAFAIDLGLPVVPTLDRGPFDYDAAVKLAEGPTTMRGASHVREGIVIKPVRERVSRGLGRVFLKLAGQGYLLRNGA